jgi:hypothetical protein
MVIIRQGTPADAIAYAELQDQEWDDSMAAVVPKLAARIATFPEGVLVAEHDGEVVGCATFIRIDDYSVDDLRSWEDVTDNGWCSTHDPRGSTLFGVDLSVSRRAPRSTSVLIFMAGMELSMRLGVDRTVWGGRMPRYHRHAATMTPEQYLAATTSRGRHLDPEIELYSKIPGVEILGVVPEYFKDWESLNYGVMLSWRNPLRTRFAPSFVRRYVVDGLYWLSRRQRTKGRKAARAIATS